MYGHSSAGPWLAWCGAIAMLLVSLVACGDDPRQLYETARLEERQRNLTHARELYERIIRDHPDSPYTEHARARLTELRKVEN